MTEHREPVVVIGIGNTLRRDDGVGPLILDACRYDPMPGCDLAELDGDASQVVDQWSDRELAVVVDAVCTGDTAGTIHDLQIDDLDTDEAERQAKCADLIGLAEALRLGRQLGRLPATLRVLGIEPGDLKRGFGLSPAVAAAMDELESRVRAAVVRCRQSPQ